MPRSLMEIKKYQASMHEQARQTPESVVGDFRRQLADYVKEIGAFPEQFGAFETRGRKTLDELLVAGMTHNLESGAEHPFRVLDVGAGNGTFLISAYDHLRKFFPENILQQRLQLVGVSLHDLRQHRDDTTTALTERRIDYIEGNMAFLRKLLNESSHDQFDCIVSVYALLYVKPPRMRKETLKDIYRLLAQDGIAAVAIPGLFEFNGKKNIAEQDVARAMDDCNQAFSERGLEIAMHPNPNNPFFESIFMKKNKNPFFLPIDFTEEGELVPLEGA